MIRQVLFRRGLDPSTPSYPGQMIHSEIPTVLCGACGKGVCLPIVNQVCSAPCSAYIQRRAKELNCEVKRTPYPLAGAGAVTIEFVDKDGKNCESKGATK